MNDCLTNAQTTYGTASCYSFAERIYNQHLAMALGTLTDELPPSLAGTIRDYFAQSEQKGDGIIRDLHEFARSQGTGTIESVLVARRESVHAQADYRFLLSLLE